MAPRPAGAASICMASTAGKNDRRGFATPTAYSRASGGDSAFAKEVAPRGARRPRYQCASNVIRSPGHRGTNANMSPAQRPWSKRAWPPHAGIGQHEGHSRADRVPDHRSRAQRATITGPCSPSRGASDLFTYRTARPRKGSSGHRRQLKETFDNMASRFRARHRPQGVNAKHPDDHHGGSGCGTGTPYSRMARLQRAPPGRTPTGQTLSLTMSSPRNWPK